MAPDPLGNYELSVADNGHWAAAAWGRQASPLTFRPELGASWLIPKASEKQAWWPELEVTPSEVTQIDYYHRETFPINGGS